MDQADQLRKLVQQQASQQKARVITVTSGKGGVGKSSIAVNLALLISKLGKRVIVLDADFGLANVEVMLGIRPQFNLADLMFRGKDLKDIITEGPENIGFISGGSGIREMAQMTKEQVIFLTQKLVELDELADVIVIDTGAGIADNVIEFVATSSEVLLVATPEPTSITDAYALLKTLNRKSEFSIDNTVIKFIANRVSNAEEGKNLFEKMRVVVSKFLNLQLEFVGAVPLDDNVVKAVMQQRPFTMLYPHSPASKALREIAQEVCSTAESEEQETKGISQLFSSLIRSKFRKKKQER